MQIVVDSSVLVGLLNPLDHRHNQSTQLIRALQNGEHELVYFDCVVGESLSTIVRRLSEKGRIADIQHLLNQLDLYLPQDQINWVLPDVPRLYTEILDLMRASSGALNFHDALIALACRDRQISLIASFDADFDQIHWLRRLSAPQDLSKFTITE